MTKKLSGLIMFPMLLLICAITLTACGGAADKLTKENFEKINSTMDYMAVEQILGKPTHDLRSDGWGRISWYVNTAKGKTNEILSAEIDFALDGKVSRVYAIKDSVPKEGGMATELWRVNYSAE